MKTINQTQFPFLQNLVTSGIVRSKDVSMAIGYGIAQNLPLPPEPSGVVNSYFVGTFGEGVDAFLSSLNNVVPIDYKEARAYARKFFKLRHHLAFGYTEVKPVTENSVYDLLGISSVFADEEIKTMEKPTGFRTLACVFVDIAKDFQV